MATSRKQITTYLPPELVQVLEEWQRAHGISSVSAAVVAILQDYLLGRSAAPGVTDTMEALVEERLTGLRGELAQVKHQVELLSEALAQTGIWERPDDPQLADEGQGAPWDEPDLSAAAMHPCFQPGDWVRYYCRGRNLVEQVLEVRPTETGIDQLLLPSGRTGVEGPELDLFPATMVTPHQDLEPRESADDDQV